MRLLTRYFLKEAIPPFFFSLFALTFILLMDQLFRLIDLFVRKGLPSAIVGQILIYNLPLIVSYTTPMALLIAIVMSFGRLSQDNEILALKANGISFLSIMKTPAIMVIITTILLVIFNFLFMPEANHRARNLMLDVVRKRPAVRLTEGIFTNEFPNFTIYIGKKNEKTSQIFDVTIYDLRNNLIITAPSGILNNLEQENIMQFVLFDGEFHQLIDNTKYQRTKFTKQVINMEIDTEFKKRERKSRSEDELTLAGLLKSIRETNQEIDRLKEEIDKIGRQGLNDFLHNDLQRLEPVRFQIEQKNSILKGKLKNLSRYLVELNKRFSLAFVSIVFLLIGAPMGYLFRRGGIAGVLLGILFFSLYYILLLTGEEFASRRNFSPFWAMWLPNFILIAPGLILFLIAENENLKFRI
uniref:YjgP/YjgQ family permease n=1 Tax=candidate division WOR-3 bacterium TaxID=2052148 RepID=A0A7C4XMU4_UNCW3